MKKFQFSEEQIKHIKQLTQENNHFDARFQIAFILSEKSEIAFGDLVDAYLNLKGLSRVSGLFGGNDELIKIRSNLDKTLKKALEIAVINHSEVWQCL